MRKRCVIRPSGAPFAAAPRRGDFRLCSKLEGFSTLGLELGPARFLLKHRSGMQHTQTHTSPSKSSLARAHEGRSPRPRHSVTVLRPAYQSIALDAADLDALLALARAHGSAEAQRQAARLRTLVGPESSLEPHIDALLARAGDLEQAERMALTDPLTGIGNRRAFADQLRRELARARRTHAPLAVLLLDLDDFKAINDRYSHAAGDQALRLAARSARQVTRQEDFVARLGGDEFAVLLPGTDAELARTIGERIRARLSSMSGAGPTLRVSFGLAVSNPNCTGAHALLAAADRELYRDKAARKSTAPMLVSA